MFDTVISFDCKTGTALINTMPSIHSNETCQAADYHMTKSDIPFKLIYG